MLRNSTTKQAPRSKARTLHPLETIHEAGHLLAASSFIGDDDETFRGLCIFNIDAERAKELCAQDPAVIAGRFSLKILPWMLPGGAISFSPTHFPHSIAEASTG